MVSPAYSPSACIQSPAYTSQVSGSALKARQYSAYSPAYSPAMSGSASKAHPDSGSASDCKSQTRANLPVQSPLYVPPSMGGAAQPQQAVSASPKHQEFVQSPQYVAHSGIAAADVTQSPAYNPASP